MNNDLNNKKEEKILYENHGIFYENRKTETQNLDEYRYLFSLTEKYTLFSLLTNDLNPPWIHIYTAETYIEICATDSKCDVSATPE